MEGLDHGLFELGDSDIALLGDGPAERLDSLEFMHCLRREVGLAARRTRPQGNAFDYQELRALAEAARDVLQLGFAGATLRAATFNRGRQ